MDGTHMVNLLSKITQRWLEHVHASEWDIIKFKTETQAVVAILIKQCFARKAATVPGTGELRADRGSNLAD